MYVKASGKPVFDANGEFRGYRGTGTDVTAIMRAQEEHERLRQLESDLAHMNRLSVMGELTASLAHEITQPIASARNNARAALNFLDKQPPDLGEVREALGCIVGDADRAGDIVDRIRDQIKKAPPRKDRFDLNQAINEVIVLARSEITKNGVSVQNPPCGGIVSRSGGSCSTATSRPEPDPERGRSNELGRGWGTRVVDQHRAKPDRRRPRGSARFRAGHRSGTSRARFRGFLHHEVAAGWEWGCRSAGPSSMPTAAGCGQTRMSLAAPYFSSPCPARKRNS